MQPPIHVNWLAVVASVVASFAFGGLWYGPLFGKIWRKAMGMTAQPSGADIAQAFVLNIVGTFLMAFVLAHDVAVWRPSTWNAGTDQSPMVYGFFAGFFIWLGYVLPVLLNSVAFERKSWTAFFIQVIYQFVSLQIMGMILSHWR
jgi:hypothetical protein